MKKILTLFAMLLVTASTLLAQTPKLSYQMVVRDSHNNLVVKDTVNVEFIVLQNARTIDQVDPVDQPDQEDVFYMWKKAVTNRNGMLSLTVSCDPEMDEPEMECRGDLGSVKWDKATIHVRITSQEGDEYVNTTMEILPVPYALMAQNQDVDITTAQIVKYLKQVDTADFEAVITAMYGNPSQNPTLEKYMVDTVLNYIKANRTAVRNMMLNWLSQMEKKDLDTVYKMFNANTEVKEAVNDLCIDFVKQHPADVKEVALYYIKQTTQDDVVAVIDAVKGNSAAFDTIADFIADTVIKYVKAHPEMVQDIAEYYIAQATKQQVDYLQATAKENEHGAYDYAVGIIDDMIQHYLDSLHYIHNADCQEADICSLLEKINTLENSEFVSCPEISKIDSQKVANDQPQYNYTYTLKNLFTKNTFDVNMNVGPGRDSLIYVLNYPGTTSKADTLFATYAEGVDTSMNIKLAFDTLMNKGQVIKVYAVARARCMDILYSDTVTFEFPKRCPSILLANNTHATKGDSLLKNNGVKLYATIDFNYPEKIADYGFLVSSENNLDNITNLNQLPEGVDVMYVNKLTAENNQNFKLNAQNTFAQNLDMKYCARKVWYRAFVGCRTANTNQDYDTTYNFYAVKKIDSVRGPEITLATLPENAIFRPFDDSVSVTAQGWFTITSKGGKNTLEYWKDNAGTYKSMLDTMYYWWGLDANAPIADGEKTIKVAPTKDTTVVGNVSVVMFGSTCTVTDSVKVKFVKQECDTLFINKDNKLDTVVGPIVKVTPDVAHAADTTCHGVKDTLTLYAASFMVHNTDIFALKDIKKNADFYNGLVDTFSYRWTNLAGNVTLGTADTLKVGVNRDSVFVCEVTIKYKNDSVCTKDTNILVHYELQCGDSLRTKEHAYATVEVNNVCWTKSNMRDTLDFTHGEQTGDISNGVPKYYNTSVLLNLFTLEQRGLLYNHDAAALVCPAGWHLPDTTEWQAMLHYVDTVDHVPAPSQYSFMKVNDTTWRTTYIYKIGAADVWPYCTGTSTVKFNAYPAGIRQINTLVPQDGSYQSMPLGSFWTATQAQRTLPEGAKDKFYSYYMYPETNAELDKYVYRADVNKIIGMSVRCVYGPVPEAAPVTETCPSTVTDLRDNNTYNTVKIGDQCWMKENLRYSLPNNNPSTQESPAVAYPNNDDGKVEAYGLLYNYYAATMDNLCPEGWRVPTQAEFETLIANVDLCKNTEGYVAKSLADSGDVWNQAYNSCLPGYTPSENNASGFSARPAGWWNNGYYGLGHGAAFWVTPTATDASNYRFYIEHNQATINGGSVNNHDCLSVRCIKDTHPQTQTQEP